MKVIVCLFALVVAAAASNFDSRTQWPGCANFILNQEQCGSCWAFCSAEAFADRMCITGEVPGGTIISPEPILECSIFGCGGGYPSTAWNWMINNGDTTCTNQCFSGCAPYDSGAGTSPQCHKGTCDSGRDWDDTYYGGAFQPVSGVNTIMNHLANNGPMQACFTIYSNFYTFFSLHPTGIYTSASGGAVGGHCVKLIGYGTEGGQDYWTYANSWDTTWGDGGYFKMARGNDLCGIESQVSEGFTGQQARKLQITGVVNSTMLVGGWQEQEDTTVDFVAEAVHETMKLLSRKEGRELKLEKVLAAKTQVVAGTNFRLVLGIENNVVDVKVFRDLNYRFHLV